jgi:trans-aconitate methyltransferase
MPHDEKMTAADDTKRFYDATADKVADEWYPNDVLMPTIREFLSHLPPKPRVLDLGCGPGHESMRLTSAGARVFGLDFSDECISVARQRCSQCQFEVADFRDLATAATDLVPCGELQLADELFQHHWRAYLFRLVKRSFQM